MKNKTPIITDNIFQLTALRKCLNIALTESLQLDPVNIFIVSPLRIFTTPSNTCELL